MERKKILKIVLALLVLLFTIMPIGTGQLKVEASEAYQHMSSTTGAVTAEDVNLRTGPATTFDIICKLKKNQKVNVIGKLGSWYAVYVSSSGNVGAINSQYIKLDKAKTTTNNTVATTKNTQSTSKAATSVSKVKDISSDEQTLFDLVNKARKEKGLKVLEFDADLLKVARLKAKDMKDNNYFSHTSKLYGTPFDMMKKYEIKFSAAGENIAGNETIEKAVKAWVEESGNNLYNGKFTHTGIGIVDSATYGKLFVQMFIKK